MKLWSPRFLWHFAWTALLADAMFSKRPLPNTDNLPADKKLRANLVDLFASNIVSGQRAQSLFSDAADAGCANVADLKKAGKGGNSNRDLRRKLLKRSAWPSLYYAKVRLYSPKLQKVVRSWLPLMLPHEALASLCVINDIATMTSTAAAAECTKSRLRDLSNQFGIERLLGFGLWGDGVPTNWGRSE